MVSTAVGRMPKAALLVTPATIALNSRKFTVRLVVTKPSCKIGTVNVRGLVSPEFQDNRLVVAVKLVPLAAVPLVEAQ